jgi:hypothetical protein
MEIILTSVSPTTGRRKFLLFLQFCKKQMKDMEPMKGYVFLQCVSGIERFAY